MVTQQFRNLNVILYTQKLEDISQEDEQYEMIKNYHEGKTNHRGIDVTYKSISSRYYFPKMHEKINKYINNCEICQIAKYERNPLDPPLSLTETPSKPFEIVHIDIFFIESDMYLTIVDKFSKFLVMYHLLSSNQSHIVQKLTEFISQYTIPQKIVCDNQFDTTIFKEFCNISFW